MVFRDYFLIIAVNILKLSYSSIIDLSFGRLRMKTFALLLLLCFSNFIQAADIIEYRADGSKTIWHDNGQRVDYDAKGQVV